ncbi:MAG: hypothetical protein A2X81_15925 [Desulfobacterales bacterium GWB2_56_26]|nr:MAG: hypothetical protein A2X81_15925 [Desulfobacterales bacterium GWB2_56_26]
MTNPSIPTIADLAALLQSLDGKVFGSYRQLLQKVFAGDRYAVRFCHIQGSPGAFPASVCQLDLYHADLGLADWSLATAPRRLATADYLIRAFAAGVERHGRQHRGAQGSGSFQPLTLPPQVLERNLVRFGENNVHLAFRISLPGSRDNRVLGRQAAEMFAVEFAGIVESLRCSVGETRQLRRHCEVVEDMVALQGQLDYYGLVAFVGDGSVLPRASGISQEPLTGAVPFHAPEELAVTVTLQNGGQCRGLGIRPGVNVVIGGGFHGKSTLLNGLVKAVYPHVPGDGRERVVTHPEAVLVSTEEGRAVTQLDISGFVGNLPGGAETTRFSTANASGSTSQAAGVVEAVQAGARFLLLDEDSSAANLLIKDGNMRRLIPEDPITSLFDRVRELYHDFSVSTLMAVGGSSEYLGVADQVIGMRNYLPVDMTGQVRGLTLPQPEKPAKPLTLSDNRRVLAESFDPSFLAGRIGKTLPVRIKPLRLQERILEYGNERLDLMKLSALVDPDQVLAIGYGLLMAKDLCRRRSLSPSALAELLAGLFAKDGLGILVPNKEDVLFLARPRRLELAAAINRLRSLKVESC